MEQDAAVKYLYEQIKKLIAVNGYTISTTRDGKFLLGHGNGYYLEADTLIEVLDYAVQKSVEKFKSDRDDLSRRILIELGVPAESII